MIKTYAPEVFSNERKSVGLHSNIHSQMTVKYSGFDDIYSPRAPFSVKNTMFVNEPKQSKANGSP
jgi:hypothetical protein